MLVADNTTNPVTIERTYSYSVTLDRQNGNGGTESIEAIFGFAMPSATSPTLLGYTFDGYFTETNGNGTQYYTASMESALNWDLTISSPTLYAKWIRAPISITVNAGVGGVAMGSGVYEEGEVITIEAIPCPNYHSIKWDDDNTDNPREITVVADATYTAIFSSVDIAETQNFASLQVFPNPTHDQVNIVTENQTISEIQIFDAKGALLETVHDFL